MASPFRFFRKYMKALLVVFVAMLMFAFVIGDPLVDYLGGGSRGRADGRDASAVAVTWDGGSLTNAQLDELTLRRRIAKAFVLGVWEAGARDALMAGVEPQIRVSPVFNYETPDRPEHGVEQDVVLTRLFADAARRVGMQISDETIIRYLDELGAGNVSRADMRNMIGSMQARGVRITIDYILDAIREEMLAHNYRRSHEFAWMTITPQQRWDDWLSVNDRIVIEAAPVAAESFVHEVPDPSDEELTKFFEEHKNRLSQPDVIGQLELPSRTPGFAIPRKVEANYIQANYDDFLAKVESEITEEEIKKFYDENRSMFIRADIGLIEDDGEQPTAAPEEGANEQPAAPEDAPNNNTETEAGTTDPAAGTEPSPPAEPAPAAEETDATKAEETEATKDGEAAPANGDQASIRTARSVFRLAAFLQEQEGQPDGEAAAPPSGRSDDPAAEQPMTETAAGEAASESTPDAPATEPAAPSAPAEEPATERPVEYQALEEVRDIIRRELAERRTADRLAELIGKIHSELDAAFNRYVLSPETDQRQPPEALTNLAQLAEKHGLEHGTTGPVSILELRELPVGRSGNPSTGAPVWQLLFLDRDLQLYQPISTIDVDGNRYIVVKTADIKGRVPELADVRDEVVREWKLQRAAELARKRAESLAKEADTADIPLGEFFRDDENIQVVRTDPFSRFTGGEVAFVGRQPQQQPFRLSQPDGLVAPGPDFMREVFELELGQVRVIMNHDHSIAYVVRLVEHLDSPDELRRAFLSEANTWPGARLMANVHAQTGARLLVNELTDRVNLDWKRTPDQIERDDRDGQRTDAA